MWRDEKYLPATGEDSYKVGIRIYLSNVSQILFGGVKLVEAFLRIEFIHENDLPSFKDHAMASIARKDEDCLEWIVFDKAAEFW